MADPAADIIALSDHVYQRTRGRLAGLTDEEYFWEPVPGCRPSAGQVPGIAPTAEAGPMSPLSPRSHGGYGT